MKISRVVIVSFSPTGSTYRVLRNIASAIYTQNIEIDISVKTPDEEHFNQDDLVIVGVPVYAGRVPEIATKRLNSLHGNETPTVIIATYGNRHYDDALLELKEIMQYRGFKPLAGATIVTQHSIVPSIAKGRPDNLDIQLIANFATKIADKIANITDISTQEELVIPGNKPYKPYKKIPFVPHANRSCKECGLCAKKCPMGAISIDNPHITNKELCISCMRCISICPTHSRKLYWHERYLSKRAIIKRCIDRKEPEFFGI
ncbi:MAG: EFR1 family ferrodoxin [Muribaculaceae bacterium]